MRTPEELVRSWRSRAEEGAAAKGRREALPEVGLGRAESASGDRILGYLAICPHSRAHVWSHFLITHPWNARENPG